MSNQSNKQATRFQSNASDSKPINKTSVLAGSKRVGPAGSKQVNPSGILTNGLITANAGGGTATKSSNIQVIFQGKILTPQSLISKKSHNIITSNSTKKKKFIVNDQTIDENAPETVEKGTISNSARIKRQETFVHGSSAIGLSNKISGKSAKGGIIEEFSTIQLSETPTTIHLSLLSLVVASDTREIIVTDEKNARYDALVKSHSNVDGFTSRPTQTVNYPSKSQNEMAAPNALRDAGSQSNSYEIIDTMKTSDTSQNDIDGVVGTTTTSSSGTDAMESEDLLGLSVSVRKFVSDTVGVAFVTPGCLLDTTNVSKASSSSAEVSSHNKNSKTTKATSKSGVASKSAIALNNTSISGDGNNRITSEDVVDHNSGLFGGGSDTNAANNSKAFDKRIGNNNTVTNSSVSSGNEIDLSSSQQGIVGQSGSRVNIGNDENENDGSSGGIAMGGVFSAEDSEEILRKAEIDKILSSPLLLKRLAMVERAIQQNANHRSQLDYRDLPDIAPISLRVAGKKGDGNDGKKVSGLMGGGKSKEGGRMTLIVGGVNSMPESGQNGQSRLANTGGDTSYTKSTIKGFKDPSKEKVKKLFSYSNTDLIQGRAVTAMVWNAASSDLLAVGYGKTDVIFDSYTPGEALDEKLQGGLVLFWSLRNPDYPEKILRTAHPVTALDFSKQSPMMLAVGLLNGDVNVYDVRQEGANWGIPVESSVGMAGGHTDPVWQLKWIIKGAERLETLVSISTDGRVLEWNLKKGLVVSNLMQLKKSGTGEGWISNTAAGMCLDFHPLDPNTYITGTEEGNIHRCSVSYNEQYLETYHGHEGPVYRAKFSNRWPSLFLTCSADWSLNLYHIKCKAPLLSIRATGENFSINDISWCPDNSTVFANVTVDAKLQIWDISVSSIDPIVTVDIHKEDEEEALEAAALLKPEGDDTATNDEEKDDQELNSPPGSPNVGSQRYSDRFESQMKDSDITPLQRITKNLASDAKKKVLTAVLFGEKNPSVVVGDNRGTVTVYRVFDPVTITHLGPLQQYEKLKSAIMNQTDPESAILLEAADTNTDSL